jgi:hypothetical protein
MAMVVSKPAVSFQAQISHLDKSMVRNVLFFLGDGVCISREVKKGDGFSRELPGLKSRTSLDDSQLMKSSNNRVRSRLFHSVAREVLARSL